MSILQLKASDPYLSTWVSASAGTGKTKILTDRVLRLLLQDVAFNKILCLTFTNAATAEMQERVISNLEKWSKLSRDELTTNLRNLLGREAKSEEINKASSLFEAYLKTGEQINFYTIHSFCQKILKKFPLEAGISPNFKIIDEIRVYQIIRIIKKQIFNLPDIEPIARFFAENFHELTIDEIFNEIINMKAKILEKNLKFPSKGCDLITHGSQIIDELSNYESQNYLNSIENSDIKNLIANIIGDELTNANLKSFFLKQDGDKKKRIVTKNIASPDSALYLELEIIQEKIYSLDQEEKGHHLILYSKLLGLIAEKIISEFELYKKKNSLLDYDDLIIYTQNLLTNSHAKEWVLYKLDGGIDHLLVDEAQDTSKNQWRIIEALIEEFYSGESHNDQNRTIFVVGDEKQSIFSFQGADISAFSYMNKFLHEKLSEGGKPFETINLDISYRSTKEILTIVTNIFSKIIKNNPSDFSVNLPEMTAHRSDHFGRVELWPLLMDENIKEDSPIWSITSNDSDNSGKVILAKKIATYVKEQINSGIVLSSTKQKISAQDFMILFRTRDEFTNEVIKALKNAEIDITGIDRIALIEDLGVVDLLSIAKFVMNPDDELNLAALLKSPIFGLSERELYDLRISSLARSASDNPSLRGVYDEAIQTSSRANASERGDPAFLDCFVASASRNDGYGLLRLLASDDVITQKLEEFLLLYKNLPLTDFFLYITDVLGYRDVISKNNDSIDEFLKLSKNYFLEYGGGMQNFIYWFQENQITIKRDTDAKNKLRIMTTHGAKGLQAPIIILCDTTKLPHSSERFIWDENDEMLSAKSSSYVPEFYENLKEKVRQKEYQEYLRLLYVGLTRAEDQLIVCGYQGYNQIPENCWYNLVKKSMEELGSLGEDGGLVYGSSSLRGAQEATTHVIARSPKDDAAIQCDNRLLRSKAPRNDVRHFGLASDAKHSQEYGLVFHKILEDAVGSKNLNNLSSHPLIATLNDKLQTRILASLQKIMANKEFIEFLKYDVKTEISFGYKNGSEIKIGRVDLLIIQEKQVTIIDYKSDSKPASNTESIPEAYLKQMAFYKEAFAAIYPNKNIDCKILWLENGGMQDV